MNLGLLDRQLRVGSCRSENQKAAAQSDFRGYDRYPADYGRSRIGSRTAALADDETGLSRNLSADPSQSPRIGKAGFDIQMMVAWGRAEGHGVNGNHRKRHHVVVPISPTCTHFLQVCPRELKTRANRKVAVLR